MPRARLPVVASPMSTEIGAYAYGDGGGAESRSTDLPQIGRVVMRHRWLILLTVIFLMGCAWAVVSSVSPRYTAEAQLMVGDQQPHALDLRTGTVEVNSDLTENEIQIVKSRRILQMVVEKLNLLQDPSINPAMASADTGFLQGLKSGPKEWLSAVVRPIAVFLGWSLAGNDAESLTADPKKQAAAAATMMSLTVDNVARHLTVEANGHSRVVSISFEAENPQTAAAVANAIADIYIQDQLNSKVAATMQANQWLSARVNELRNQVVSTDHTVQQRKAAAGISQGRQDALINEQISTLSEQLTLAQADLATAEARAAQGGSATSDEDASVANSPLLDKLRADQSTLEAQIAQSQQVMGERNPQMRQLRAEQAANAAAIKSATRRTVGGVRTNSAASRARNLAVARTREATLRKSLNDLEAQANRIGSVGVDIRAQQSEVEANRNLFDQLLSRAKETSIEGGLLQPDAHVVAAADAPLRPSYPNKPLTLFLALIGAGLVASLLVVALESFDHGFRDLAEAEEALGVPALGYVPQVARGERPERHVIDKPFSQYSEAIRSLYTSLKLSDMANPPKVILIASSLPDEGKTAVSVSLARLVARAGKRVLIIDSDLRKPSVHHAFGVSSMPGLVDYLMDAATIEQILVHDPESNVLLLPSGSHAPNPADIFTSEAMQRLLDTLSRSFDLIILDSAPLLAVSDTRNLCRLVDKVLFLVRWHHTREVAAIPAIRQVLEAGGDVAGVVLSMTDLKQLKAYSGSAYYQRQVMSYINYAKS